MADGPGRLCLRVVIKGRVQGVWYRGWTVAEARDRALDGWVRNRPDGTVEAVVAGPADAVEGLLRACLNGPPMANVSGIQRFAVAPDDVPAQGSGFDQRPTG